MALLGHAVVAHVKRLAAAAQHTSVRGPTYQRRRGRSMTCETPDRKGPAWGRSPSLPRPRRPRARAAGQCARTLAPWRPPCAQPPASS
eukprot:2163701-Rhodomonas_salina.2